MDHFLDLTLRPVEVLFITTANYLAPVPRPLRDRMESDRDSGLHRRGKNRDRAPASAGEEIAAHGLKPESVEILRRDLGPARPRLHAGSRRPELEREVAAVAGVAREVVRGRGPRLSARRKHA